MGRLLDPATLDSVADQNSILQGEKFHGWFYSRFLLEFLGRLLESLCKIRWVILYRRHRPHRTDPGRYLWPGSPLSAYSFGIEEFGNSCQPTGLNRSSCGCWPCDCSTTRCCCSQSSWSFQHDDREFLCITTQNKILFLLKTKTFTWRPQCQLMVILVHPVFK